MRFDDDFAAVMRACAAPRRDGPGTWITADIIDAYTRPASRGRRALVETWLDGERVGGVYGVSFGRMFFGESMFAHVTDASKIALAALVGYLRRHGVR